MFRSRVFLSGVRRDGRKAGGRARNGPGKPRGKEARSRIDFYPRIPYNAESGDPAREPDKEEKRMIAKYPPMGWNSWDC